MISFKPFEKLLIDREMSKKELALKCNISQSTFTRMKNGQNIGTDILNRLCIHLNCNVSDLLEFIPEGDRHE